MDGPECVGGGRGMWCVCVLMRREFDCTHTPTSAARATEVQGYKCSDLHIDAVCKVAQVQGLVIAVCKVAPDHGSCKNTHNGGYHPPIEQYLWVAVPVGRWM